MFDIKKISTNMKRNKERLRLGERLLKVNYRTKIKMKCFKSNLNKLTDVASLYCVISAK